MNLGESDMINDIYVKKETSIQDKELFLKSTGAVITKNLDGSITITGPFSISTYEDSSSAVLYNSGTITVESYLPFLYKFNNLPNGTLHIKSGRLEDIFIRTTTKLSPHF